MDEVRVVYHRDDETWWAESPNVPGYTALADSLSQLREQVFEGLAFHSEVSSLAIVEDFGELGQLDATMYRLRIVDRPTGTAKYGIGSPPSPLPRAQAVPSVA